MLVDLKGRVKNIKLPKYKALFPLYEAIINSIHSIEEDAINNGFINIFVDRDESQASLFDQNYDRSLFPIDGFSIVDNGIGFDDSNFKSFKTSDTTYKEIKGAKGVGRFLWLKAFTNVSIDSIYKSENDYYNRKFEFNLSTNEGVCNEENRIITSQLDKKTSVKLSGFMSHYREYCPKKSTVIAQRIIEHCLIYFLWENLPQIKLIDGNEEIDLNKYFNDNIKPQTSKEKFEVKSKSFELTSVKFYGGESSEHSLHFCAHYREVIKENLSNYIVNLRKRKLRDEQEKPFTYFAYISSEYLDDSVNSERISFNIIENLDSNSLFLQDFVTMEDIKNNSIITIRSQLGSLLDDIKEKKDERIREHVIKRSPQYRALVKHYPDKLDEIEPGLSDEQLDIELYKLNSRVNVELKLQKTDIIEKPIAHIEKYPEYVQKYHHFLEQYNDFGKSKLAEYIVHRKTIIDLFASNLKRNEDGRYKLEKDIHEIIFPLKTTSDDIDFEKQNLWIIDEKLSYHKYLASEQPLNQLDEVISIDDDDRPDLIVFNHPFAFVEEGDYPYSSIVIIEFKRPMRKNYNDEENPISQVMRYIRKIKSGNYEDKNGRLIDIPESLPFYAYIICDLTKRVKDYALEYDFKYLPDKQGYFRYQDNLNAYFEIISFNKLVYDAQKRNNVLFKKLQIL